MLALAFYATLLALGLSITREALVIAGVYKDPLLRRFEAYGVEADVEESPLLALLLGLALLLTLLLLFLISSAHISILAAAFGVLLYILHQNRHALIARYPAWLLAYPRWRQHLTALTTREERRRIAYLWLHLPLRTRLLYNTHDSHFYQWADIVLLTII